LFARSFPDKIISDPMYLGAISRNQGRRTRHATSSGVGLMRGGLRGEIEMEGNSRLGGGAGAEEDGGGDIMRIHQHGISAARCGCIAQLRAA